MRPSSEGKIEILGETLWTNDPFSGGAYHMFAPGQVKQFGANLTDPFGRVHFAGEQTAIFMVGIEAAMEAGERAAFQISDRVEAS